MKNKKVLVSALIGISTLAVGAVVGLVTGEKTGFGAHADPEHGEWHHYSQSNPTSGQKGVREYWVECGGSYQFTAPDGETIVDKGTEYDLSGFTADDPRYLNYQFDENHVALKEYNYGAGMYSVDKAEFNNYRINYGENGYDCKLYSEGDDFFLWRIDLPRINFKEYSHVTMKVVVPGPEGWNAQNLFGPEANDLSHHTNWGGNKDKGKIELDYYNEAVHMKFWDIEYGNQVWFTNEFGSSNIINGLASAYFYVTDKWDRYLNISDITLAKHVDDGNGVCTTCHHAIDGRVLSNTLFKNVVESTGNPAAPAGFEKNYKQTALHGEWTYLAQVDVSHYKKLYFDIYNTKNSNFFSGGGKTFWTDRWNQFYMEKIDGTWHAYGKDPGEAVYTELTVDSQSTAWHFMFKICTWGNLVEHELYTTELVGVPE